jgi:hypothetical protein
MSKAEIAPDPWSLRFRTPRTIRSLSGLDVDRVARLVWDRVLGVQADNLPLFEFQERGADLFIDVVDQVRNTPDVSIAVVLRDACGLLLHEKTDPLIDDVDAVGELLYLAARIESKSSIPPISNLITHAQAEERLVNGETIRQRAIRALIGLLSKYRDAVTDRHRAIFFGALSHGDSALMAITGLVAMFGQDRGDLLAHVHSAGLKVRPEELDLSLRLLR